MNAPRDTFVTLLDKLCVYEKLERPVFSLVHSTGQASSCSVRVRVSVGMYGLEASGPTVSSAGETAAQEMHEHMMMLPSIHSIPGILRQAASRVPPGQSNTAYIQKLKRRSWLRRQKRQMKNILLIYENHRGLFELYSQRKRIRAMKELHGSANPEVLVSRAADALGLTMHWAPYRFSRLPLVALKLKYTNPKLKFLGYDRHDAAKNCVKYLKFIMMEKREVPGFF